MVKQIEEAEAEAPETNQLDISVVVQVDLELLWFATYFRPLQLPT